MQAFSCKICERTPLQNASGGCFWLCECRKTCASTLHCKPPLFLVFIYIFWSWIVIWMDSATNIFLWMSYFTTILSQIRGCWCYVKYNRKQLEWKFCWFHRLAGGKNRFGRSCLILLTLLALNIASIYSWQPYI